MKKSSGKKTLGNSLSELLDKFAQNDVIAALEEDYYSRPSKIVAKNLIDDNSIVKKVKLSPATVSRFAESIRKNGIYNPLVVRPKGNHYELILGRRRFHGGKLAGLNEFPCVILNVQDEEMLLMLLADARDQRDADVVELALVFKVLNDKYGYTHETLAQVSHLSRSQVTNILRILRLPEPVLEEISLGKLSYGHAKAIASLSEEEMRRMVESIHRDGLSVRQTEKAVASLEGKEGKSVDKGEAIAAKIGAEKILIKKKSVTISFPDEDCKESFINKLFDADL
ncbi:MAG: ParB/RepB/Spo0J family partition protein [Bacillota bacterium]|nr:ParB/RepB/Spo0J family partition protein [Bacillota bacterium]